MTRLKRVRREVDKLPRSGTLGIAGLVFLLGSGLSWAGPPNPTPSDQWGNTAGGDFALHNNTDGVITVNTAFGASALSFNTTGGLNSAFGGYALLHNITGNFNSAFGLDALFGNTTGASNSAFGAEALIDNIGGGGNSAFGALSLMHNNTGSDNSAFGSSALEANNTGYWNSAFGVEALHGNTESHSNSAFGAFALYHNMKGDYNSAFGDRALFDNTGALNTAGGASALGANLQGYFNTALGGNALLNNTYGSWNTAVGGNALFNNGFGDHNTAIGWGADIAAAGLNIYNSTALGHGATLTESDSIVLGNSDIKKIYAKVAITTPSDRRLKKDIRALDADLGLDFIEKLKPVSYRFNNGDETERYGFIAQDLEQALPASLHDTIEKSEPEHGLALIERQNDKDRTYRISYGELFAPIVKSIQEQQQEIADLRRALKDQAAAFKAENDALRHSIEALRVSAAR